MAKARKTPGSMKIPRDVLAELNDGTREASNLVEGLAVDFVALYQSAFPELPTTALRPLQVGKPSITERMNLAGQIALEHFGYDDRARLFDHTSDTVRGWGAYMVGLAPGLSLAERLQHVQPLANDAHFGVREWAWLAVRPHLATDIKRAIALLEPWVHDASPYVRRFATEATRPRGVWCAHIPELKEQPRLGLPLLKPLRADPEKYVQDSVSNWLNDAAKSQPSWVRDLVEGWADGCDNPHTLRICKRALRSVPLDD